MKATKAEVNRALYGTKYKAQRTNGYASKAEANTAALLHALVRGKQITDLQEQVPFELIPGQKGKLRNESPLKYVADFVWKDLQGRLHVGDTKGARTALYIAKRKLMKFVHGIEIEEL